jgi:hypothetical protein
MGTFIIGVLAFGALAFVMMCDMWRRNRWNKYMRRNAENERMWEIARAQSAMANPERPLFPEPHPGS